MQVRQTKLPGVLIFEPTVYSDHRGFFVETWKSEEYRSHGVSHPFVQDNLSKSCFGVLRGMHLQNPYPQGKLVYVVSGEIYDAAVDIRKGSPCFGQWIGIRLNDRNRHQIYVPPGLAHGFCVLSETAIVAYKVTDIYNPPSELSLLWNDPDVGIEWPIPSAVISEKDRLGLRLRNLPPDRLIGFEP